MVQIVFKHEEYLTSESVLRKQQHCSFQLLAIDPSIISLGCSLLLSTGNVVFAGRVKQTTSTKIAYQTRSMAMLFAVNNGVLPALIPNIPLIVVIEAQERFISQRGRQSTDAESIQRLYYFTGGLTTMLSCVHLPKIPTRDVYTITPSKWKGQLPKSIIVKRAHAYVPLKEKTPHDTCEALMLGKHALAHYDLVNTVLTLPYIKITHVQPHSFNINNYLLKK